MITLVYESERTRENKFFESTISSVSPKTCRAPLKRCSDLKTKVQLWALGLSISLHQNYQFRRIRFNKMLKMDHPLIRSITASTFSAQRGSPSLAAAPVSAAQEK